MNVLWSRLQNFLERRKDRKLAQNYNKAISAPLSPEAAERIRKRLEDGTVPRRKVRRRDCESCEGGCGDCPGLHDWHHPTPLSGLVCRRCELAHKHWAGERCPGQRRVLYDVYDDVALPEVMAGPDHPGPCGWFTGPDGVRRHGIEQGPPGSTDFKPCSGSHEDA